MNNITTQICSSDLPEKIIEAAHKATVYPSLAIGFVGMLCILMLGSLFVKKSGRGKYIAIILFSLFVSGIFYLGISLMPHTVQDISNFVKNIW